MYGSSCASRLGARCKLHFHSSSALLLPRRPLVAQGKPIYTKLLCVARQLQSAMVNTIILKPAIWCIRVYDDFWAPKLRRAPDIIHEIAVSGQSITTVSPPNPLPRNRKRALTNPLLEIDVEHGLSYSIRRLRQRNDEQAESSFITMLPQELRALVYCEILNGGDKPLIHLMRKATKFGHWRCRLQGTQETCDTQNRRCFEGFLTYRTQQRQMDLTGRLEVKTDTGLLPLLLTCRIM